VLPSRLGVRFALEALFLVGLAIGAGLADLRPALIVGVMAVAWLLVALIELAAERIARSPVSYLLPTPVSAEEEGREHVFEPRPEERTVVAPPVAQPLVRESGPVEEAIEAPGEAAQPETEAEIPEPGPPTPEPETPMAEPESPGPEPEPVPVERAQGSRRRWLGLGRAREPEHLEPIFEQPDEAPAPDPVKPTPEPEPLIPASGAIPEAEHLSPEPGPPKAQDRSKHRWLRRRREEELEPPPPPAPRHVKLLPRRSAPDPTFAAREIAELFGPEADESQERKEDGG
jgi:hypothetical protein